MSVKMAEEMLCKMTNALKDEIESCLDGFPKREDLMPSKPTVSYGSEYVRVIRLIKIVCELLFYF